MIRKEARQTYGPLYQSANRQLFGVSSLANGRFSFACVAFFASACSTGSLALGFFSTSRAGQHVDSLERTADFLQHFQSAGTDALRLNAHFFGHLAFGDNLYLDIGAG